MEDLLGGAEVKQKGPVDTSLYGQLWTHGLKQGLGLPAPRMVIIQEWHVGVLLRVMQLGAIMYLCWQAFTQQQYLYFNQPTGSVFPILTDAALDGAQNLLAQQVRRLTAAGQTLTAEAALVISNCAHAVAGGFGTQVRDGQPVQCHQPQMSQYSYAFDSDRSFPITACFGMSLPQLVSPDTNALFIKTMARVQVRVSWGGA
jgi:hypothetical protein